MSHGYFSWSHRVCRRVGNGTTTLRFEGTNVNAKELIAFTVNRAGNDMLRVELAQQDSLFASLTWARGIGFSNAPFPSSRHPEYGRTGAERSS